MYSNTISLVRPDTCYQGRGGLWHNRNRGGFTCDKITHNSSTPKKEGAKKYFEVDSHQQTFLPLFLSTDMHLPRRVLQTADQKFLLSFVFSHRVFITNKLTNWWCCISVGFFIYSSVVFSLLL